MSIQTIVHEGQHFTALIFPDIGRDTVRLVFSHNDELRIVLWMHIGVDGSLYLNDRLSSSEKPTKFYKTSGIADGKGSFSESNVPYVKESALVSPEKQKISYHASGRVKGYGDFTQSINLREITERTLIQSNQYTKPERYSKVEEGHLRNTDILIPAWDGAIFKLDTTKPLMCRVFVEPLIDGRTQLGIIERPDTPSQTALVFPATGLFDSYNNKPVQDLTYHLHFFNEELGNNPDYTFTSFVRLRS